MEIIELLRIEDAYIAGYKSFLAKNNLYIFEDKKGTLLVFVSTFAPYRQDTETAFRAPFRMGNARNAVSAIFLFGKMQSSCHTSRTFPAH